MKLRVWMVEQAVLLVLVALAIRAQLVELAAWRPLDPRTVVPLVFVAATMLVAQKVRSIADRQREADIAAGVVSARIECYRAQGRYGAALQALGLFTGFALAPTLWHAAIAVYAAFYGVAWRPAYRRWIRPLRPGVAP